MIRLFPDRRPELNIRQTALNGRLLGLPEWLRWS
jgi:hypothetical protein